MKHVAIVANWKSHKTVAEARSWLKSFKMPTGDHTIIICASFTLLHFLHEQSHAFQLGAQDVSPFGDGAYTGEVSARQIKELADWVIIGHSERRQHFRETDAMLAQKVDQAKKEGLQIIYCVQDENIPVPQGVDLIAYEPVWAIGTGKSDTPENANTVVGVIKAKTHVPVVIYGGSVTPDNVASIVSQESIDGVLPGGASLDPMKFGNLIKNAIS